MMRHGTSQDHIGIETKKCITGPGICTRHAPRGHKGKSTQGAVKGHAAGP